MWLFEQVDEHAPQFSGSLVVLTSQPFVCLLPSQSPKPVAHVPLQTPPLHVRVAMPEFEQTMPQPPQLSGSFRTSTSQPSLCLLRLQSMVPEAHAPLQVPLKHVRLGMLLPEQIVLQPPQLFGSLDVAVSQPSVCLLPLQSVKPVTHGPLQTPAPHVRDAMLLPEHAVLHVPQLFGSVPVAISQPSVCLLPLQSE
jgi:hypothetical protein